MGIENSMYLALGFLAALLLALMIAPAIWRRAVRLTRARIEAATPITLNEFRAEKDQLRARFALDTRRLEQTTEALRARLTEQLSELDRARADMAQAIAERDRQQDVAGELQERTETLHAQIAELEKANADLAQRLRMREREYEDLRAELEAARAGTALQELAAERDAAEQRAEEAEAQLTASQSSSSDVRAAAAEVRQALARLDRERANDAGATADAELAEAETQLASAGDRLNAILEESQAATGDENTPDAGSLAATLSRQDELEDLHRQIAEVETGIAKDWRTERFNPAQMRERLATIAAEVSGLVYAVDRSESAPAGEESLLDRVRKYAGEDIEPQAMEPANADPGSDQDGLARRMSALREAQARP